MKPEEAARRLRAEGFDAAAKPDGTIVVVGKRGVLEAIDRLLLQGGGIDPVGLLSTEAAATNFPAPVKPPEPPSFCDKCGGTPERRRNVRTGVGMTYGEGPCADAIHLPSLRRRRKR